ncbi:MAG TPA: DUF4038 domain-containing protein [Vineibacter sp.]|nr:DUF4038 domain-containing protein [Vineibacter sp.]
MKRRSLIALITAAACAMPAAAQDARTLPAVVVKPVILGESHYDGEWGPQPYDLVTRKQAYWTMLSGGAGHAYGAKGVWGWGDPRWGPNFQAALNAASAAQMKHVSDLFTTRAWHRLMPDLDGTIMTRGAGEGVDYATTARASDGSLVIAYIPTERTVSIDMGRLAGPAIARWFDPTNGRYTAIAGATLANRGSRDFTTPGNNAIGHSDWVLVLETGWLGAAAPAAAFPLKVSRNGRYLVDRTGRAFFYQADTPWWMIWKGRPADIHVYLANRKARGFNTLQIMMLPAGAAPDAHLVNEPDVNGNRPFRDGKILDVAAVNEAYMRHADQVIRQASAAGFYLVLAPAWFGSKGGDFEAYITDHNAAAWGRYLANRYRAYQNIAWIMAGDSNAEGKSSAVRAMAQAFKAVAPHQLVTAHAGVQSSFKQYHAEGWLDFNMAYDYTWGGAWVYPQVRRDYLGK